MMPKSSNYYNKEMKLKHLKQRLQNLLARLRFRNKYKQRIKRFMLKQY